jgi:hypothetical protein
MRRLLPLLAACLFASGALAACSGGGGDGSSSSSGGGDGPAATCAALDDLAGTAQAVEQADVTDPEAFEQTLERSVEQYTDRLDALRDVAPESLQRAIDRVERAVDKHDFPAALTARAPLDAYAAKECGPAASTPSSSSG